MKDRREGHKITESGPTDKTEGGNKGERNDDPFFVMVQAGRDKSPDLEKDNGAGQDGATDEC